MLVSYTPALEKDLSRLRDPGLSHRVEQVIASLKAADSLRDVPGVVKLAGFDRDYRIRLGDYRLGFSLEDGVVILHRLLPRRDSYRYFP